MNLSARDCFSISSGSGCSEREDGLSSQEGIISPLYCVVRTLGCSAVESPGNFVTRKVKLAPFSL